MSEFPEDQQDESQLSESGQPDSEQTRRKSRARERQERRRRRNPNLRNEVLQSLEINTEGLPDPADTLESADTARRANLRSRFTSDHLSDTDRADVIDAEYSTVNSDELTPYDPSLHDASSHDTTSRNRRARRTPSDQPMPREWVPRAARQRARQVVPAGGFKLPDVDRRFILAVVYLLGGIGLVSGIIFALGLFREDEPEIAPNAIWIGTEWTYESPPEDEVQAFAQQLRDADIGTVYAWVSWMKEDGGWAGIRAQENTFEEVREDVRTFVIQFKEAYPESELLGWVSFPVELGPEGYRLDDPELQQTIADFSLIVVTELGFDGVFLNVEQVWNDNADDFIDLLQTVRAEVGDNGLIAVAIPPDWSPLDVDIPKPPLIRPGTEWDKAFKQRVALMTDQMAVMAYNSGLSDPNDYAEWVAYQVQAYAEAVFELNLETGPEVFIGIPTYDDELPGHTVEAENIPSAVLGVEQGLEASGAAAQVVQGVSIYAGWETDETEWQQFRDLWSNR